ncbi:hypothetical protein HMPREF0731_2705, partial [Pseudoroseomonas cervicalis ATCC 49957]
MERRGKRRPGRLSPSRMRIAAGPYWEDEKDDHSPPRPGGRRRRPGP